MLKPRLAIRPRGQQRPALVDEALKAVRSHVQGSIIKRVFIPGHCFLALHLKDPVDLALDFRQVRLGLCCSYAATEGIEQIQRLFALPGFAIAKEFPGRRQH